MNYCDIQMYGDLFLPLSFSFKTLGPDLNLNKNLESIPGIHTSIYSHTQG